MVRRTETSRSRKQYQVRIRHEGMTRILFLAPFMIPLFVFWLLPIFISLGISFTDWDYISPTAEFVGLENYERILTSSELLESLTNTIVFGFGTIGPTIVLGLMFALLVQGKFSGSKIYQSIIFSPWITPAVAVSLVWSWIYEPERGFANFVLGLFGVSPLKWLQSSDTAMLAIIIFTVWKSIGWTMLFYIGALERVPKGVQESARIDGAGFFSRLFHITIPLISPTTYFLFIINLIASIQVYDQIDIMTQGGPGRATTTLLYLYYDKAFQNFQMGAATVVAMLILVITVALSLMSTYFGRDLVHYES